MSGLMETIRGRSWLREYCNPCTRITCWHVFFCRKPWSQKSTRLDFIGARPQDDAGRRPWTGMIRRRTLRKACACESCKASRLGTRRTNREVVCYRGLARKISQRWNECGCFVYTLPATEYALEIRELNLKQVYDREANLNIIRSQYKRLLPTFGKSKRSSNSLALVGKGGRDHGGGGGRGHGKDRSEKGKECGNRNKDA